MTSRVNARNPLPLARRIPFASFNNRYAKRTCYIVGRGVTDFDYAQLAGLAEPIFFINDAICLERLVSAETFFFAHDRQLVSWLDGSVRGTAVLPIDGKVFLGEAPAELKHRGDVVYYHWRERRRDELLRMTRDQLAAAEMLYTHSGTIHSALHFIWYCGFSHVRLIGCDGIPRTSDPASRFSTGHDPRLENRSGPEAAWQYYNIRVAQDALIRMLGLTSAYLGTPREALEGPDAHSVA